MPRACTGAVPRQLAIQPHQKCATTSPRSRDCGRVWQTRSKAGQKLLDLIDEIGQELSPRSEAAEQTRLRPAPLFQLRTIPLEHRGMTMPRPPTYTEYWIRDDWIYHPDAAKSAKYCISGGGFMGC